MVVILRHDLACLPVPSVVRFSRTVVSVDGKTRTIHTTGTDDKGQPVNMTAIYEKQ
jgi:hypothetical protein